MTKLVAKLASKFVDNFEAYKEEADPSIIAAAPKDTCKVILFLFKIKSPFKRALFLFTLKK